MFVERFTPSAEGARLEYSLLVTWRASRTGSSGAAGSFGVEPSKPD
jgi:hypothetical protein